MPRLVMSRPRVQRAAPPRIQPVETTRLRGRKLQARRRRLLSANPLCEKCSTLDHPVAATELDHVVPLWKGGPDVEDNLQRLCDDCHRVKSDAEARERASLYPQVPP